MENQSINIFTYTFGVNCLKTSTNKVKQPNSDKTNISLVSTTIVLEKKNTASVSVNTATSQHCTTMCYE